MPWGKHTPSPKPVLRLRPRWGLGPGRKEVRAGRGAEQPPEAGLHEGAQKAGEHRGAQGQRQGGGQGGEGEPARRVVEEGAAEQAGVDEGLAEEGVAKADKRRKD